jgi:putative transposase
MKNITTPSLIALRPDLEAAWQDVDISFDRFCLVAGIGAMEQVLREDAQRLTGPRHGRGGGRVGHRWGITKGKIGFHGCNVAVQRPRVRSYDGHEVELPSWTAAQAEDWLGRWAMNLMLINVCRRASYGALYGCLRTIYRPSPETAPRNRRHRAGSWRYLPSGLPSG